MVERNRPERLAEYDYLALGRLLRPKLMEDGRGWRVCADAIGVSASDLARICNGQSVSAAKAIAVCDWLDVSFRAFYSPAKRACSTEMFHGNSTETGACAHAR